MPGSWGNYNLYRASSVTFIDYVTSNETVVLPVGTEAVTLFASTKCYVKIGDPGDASPVAAIPSAEKAWVQNQTVINAKETIDLPVALSTDGSLVTIAVIAAAGGTLDIIARKES